MALRVFRDTLAALLNLCVDPTVVHAKTGLERGLLVRGRLGVEGACGNGWQVGTVMSRSDGEKNWKAWSWVCPGHRNGGESQRLSHPPRSRQQAKENPLTGT